MLKIEDLITIENKIIKFHYLSKEILKEKLVSSNFSTIKHLRSSRLTEDKDSYMDKEAQIKFIQKKRGYFDNIVVTEKIDGMNAGIYRKGNEFYPLNRKGYDVRTGIIYSDGTINWLFFFWAYEANKIVRNITRVFDPSYINKVLFPEGYRYVFENTMLTHTLKYNFKKSSPMFLLSIFDKKNNRLTDKEIEFRANELNFQRPPKLSEGIALDPIYIIDSYDRKSLVGCKDDMEGVVYVYERYDAKEKKYKVESTAKFVSNPNMGTQSEFPNKFNDWYEKDKYIDIRNRVSEEWFSS